MNNMPDNLPEIPAEFLRKMAGLLGDEYDNFFRSLRQPAKIGLRVNTLKITAEEFTRISPYKISTLSWCNNGFIFDGPKDDPGFVPPGKHPYHTAGLFYLQEPSAMVAAEVLSPQPGETVLDLSAAPGGKTTHLAGLMKNTGLLVANEIHPRRVWDLAENLERCGVTNAVVTNETPNKLADHFGGFFDRVLVDAPCSGEGMFRKNPGARTEWNLELPKSCAIRQSAILEQAARMVKLGGRMLYTTCTFSPEENEGVVARFLEKHPEFELASIKYSTGFQSSKPGWIGLPPDHKLNHAVRIWPHISPGEGHFIALLVKNGPMSQNRSSNNKPQLRFPRSLAKPKGITISKGILDDFTRENLTFSFELYQLSVKGSYIYKLADKSPQLDGLKVIHPGWWLGTIRKERLIPSHALAMGLHIDQVRLSVTFQSSDRQIMAYLAGESFTNQGENGWVLITVDGFPIGWGKRVQNVIKNYYPHGLRRSSPSMTIDG
jgi:NOL1/NOP2/sun family putative RNA methylase